MTFFTKEKRKYKRAYLLQTPVMGNFSIPIINKMFYGQILNVSEGGLCIKAETIPDAVKGMQLLFKGSDDLEIFRGISDMRMKISYIEEYQYADSSTIFSTTKIVIGCKFKKILTPHKNAILNIIEHYSNLKI
ncbi:MAG: PilZ domain-containing protein [Desulfobacterales bacterium]|nr:PilZ domain-containing protein [Desulfobacterales bacterium]